MSDQKTKPDLGELLTEGEVLLLWILSEGENYPYGVQKLIDERQAHNWVDIGFSSIYHALERFEKKGLVKSSHRTPLTKEKDKSKRKQKWFSLAEKGEEALKNNAIFLISEYKDKSPSSIGFANCSLFSNSELKELFCVRKEKIQQRIKTIEQRKQEVGKFSKASDLPIVEVLFDYALEKHKTELKFVEKLHEKSALLAKKSNK